MDKLGKVISMADKVVSSPAAIGVAGLLKGGFDKLSKSDMLKQAAEARLGPAGGAASVAETAVTATPQSTAAMVADTYGGAANVPPNIIANMSDEDKQALVGLYTAEATAQPAPAIPPLATAVAGGEGPGMVAEAKSVAQEDERRARSVEATNAEDEQEFVKKKETKMKAFQSTAKNYTDTAKQLGLLASMEDDPVEARALKEEARKMRLMAVAELRKISGEEQVKKTAAPQAERGEVQFPPEIASAGDKIIDAGQASVDAIKERILSSENPTPQDEALLSYLEEMAPGKVGEVSREAAPLPDVQKYLAPTPPPGEYDAIKEGNLVIAKGEDAVANEIHYLNGISDRTKGEEALLAYLKAQRGGSQAAQVPAASPILDERLPDVLRRRSLKHIPEVPTASQTARQPDTTATAPSVSPDQSGVAQQPSPASFDLGTPAGIYAAAKMAKTARQQAIVMQAASQVLRPERKAPSTIFEAFGAGGPTQAGARQLAMVNALFPKIKTQTEKDLANAELARARAEQARAQARLIGEKGISEGALRGAKLGTEIAKKYKLRATANAALDQAKAALIRANKSGRGRGRATSNLKRAVKDATAKNKALRRSAEAQNRAFESERRALAKHGNPGPKPVWRRASDPSRTAAGQAFTKRLRKWEEDDRNHKAAKERIDKIDAGSDMNNTIINETFKNDADILEDAKRGVASVKKSLSRRSKRKTAPKTPPAKSQVDEDAAILRGEK